MIGGAHEDPGFNDQGSVIRYAIDTEQCGRPVSCRSGAVVSAGRLPLGAQPRTVQAAEPQRFVGYYEAEARDSAVLLAKAEATR